jgi:hypothetical protein
MKKFLLILLLLAPSARPRVLLHPKRRAGAKIDTTPVSKGAVAQTVPATGTLEAVDRRRRHAGLWHRARALRRLQRHRAQGPGHREADPTLIQTQIEQQKANVIRAEADLERLRVGLADSKESSTSPEDVREEPVPRNDLEAAELAVKNAEVQSARRTPD